jgi:hypothetical protein
MSREETTINWAKMGGICFVIVTLGSLVIWLAAVPTTLTAQGKDIEALKLKDREHSETLARIDERLKRIQDTLDKQR